MNPLSIFYCVCCLCKSTFRVFNLYIKYKKKNKIEKRKKDLKFVFFFCFLFLMVFFWKEYLNSQQFLFIRNFFHKFITKFSVNIFCCCFYNFIHIFVYHDDEFVRFYVNIFRVCYLSVYFIFFPVLWHFFLYLIYKFYRSLDTMFDIEVHTKNNSVNLYLY